jgi:DNA-directed RNA polymerase subunit RPC12/RpoP
MAKKKKLPDYEGAKPLRVRHLYCFKCAEEFKTINDAFIIKCPKCQKEINLK